MVTFLPTRPLRDATVTLYRDFDGKTISTHASLAGRDLLIDDCKAQGIISTHASLAGRDAWCFCSIDVSRDFNPRVPCGTRHFFRRIASIFFISTHASLAGRDGKQQKLMILALKFQPTRPLRDATKEGQRFTPTKGDFNPRVPCGTRLGDCFPVSGKFEFQPTRPLRDATSLSIRFRRNTIISTHASLAGRDVPPR